MGRPFAASIPPPPPPNRTIVEQRASERTKYRVFISLRNVFASGWDGNDALPASHRTGRSINYLLGALADFTRREGACTEALRAMSAMLHTSSDGCTEGEIGLFVLLSRTQAGPGRTVKQEQKEISRNHVQTLICLSVIRI